jgi:hypothetical protein
MAIKIFVSHSSRDRELVAAFVRALEDSMVVDDGELRCTSLPGRRPRTGAGLPATLKKEVNEANVIIGLLTPESLESGWVMFELGAGWGAEKWVVPVIAGIDYDSLPGPLKDTLSADATNQAELEQMFQEIAETLGLKRRQAGRAADAIKALIEVAEAYVDDDKDEDQGEEEDEDEDEEEEDDEDEEDEDDEDDDE